MASQDSKEPLRPLHIALADEVKLDMVPSYSSQEMISHGAPQGDAGRCALTVGVGTEPELEHL